MVSVVVMVCVGKEMGVTTVVWGSFQGKGAMGCLWLSLPSVPPRPPTRYDYILPTGPRGGALTHAIAHRAKVRHQMTQKRR